MCVKITCLFLYFRRMLILPTSQRALTCIDNVDEVFHYERGMHLIFKEHTPEIFKMQVSYAGLSVICR